MLNTNICPNILDNAKEGPRRRARWRRICLHKKIPGVHRSVVSSDGGQALHCTNTASARYISDLTQPLSSPSRGNAITVLDCCRSRAARRSQNGRPASMIAHSSGQTKQEFDLSSPQTPCQRLSHSTGCLTWTKRQFDCYTTICND